MLKGNFHAVCARPACVAARTLLQTLPRWSDVCAFKGKCRAEPKRLSRVVEVIKVTNSRLISKKCHIVAGASPPPPRYRWRLVPDAIEIWRLQSNQTAPFQPHHPQRKTRSYIRRTRSASIGGGEQWSYFGEFTKWFEMSCVGCCWKSPRHACLLFCILVPAGQTPLIDATPHPVAVVFSASVQYEISAFLSSARF